jgi:hypothetical protein
VVCSLVGNGHEADGVVVCWAIGVVVGRGTTCARWRLVGAKTPWKRVIFAYVGGMRGS